MVNTTQNFGRTVLYMNGIFIFPILFSLIGECQKLTGKRQTDMDGHVYEPYESEKVRKQREQAKSRHKLMSVFFFLAALFAAGGLGYIIYLVSFFSFNNYK